jgi:hypothetical protein
LAKRRAGATTLVPEMAPSLDSDRIAEPAE